MRIASPVGKENTSPIDVYATYDVGVNLYNIPEDGEPLPYVTLTLNIDEAEGIDLRLGGDDDEWLHIAEVRSGIVSTWSIIAHFVNRLLVNVCEDKPDSPGTMAWYTQGY